MLSTVVLLALAWFIRLYLGGERLWLLWLTCGLRAVMLVLDFVPGPVFYFREVTRWVILRGEVERDAKGIARSVRGCICCYLTDTMKAFLITFCAR